LKINKQDRKEIKIVILKENKVEKSSITARYIPNVFTESIDPTVMAA
jgi:hypothetical protein